VKRTRTRTRIVPFDPGHYPHALALPTPERERALAAIRSRFLAALPTDFDPDPAIVFSPAMRALNRALMFGGFSLVGQWSDEAQVGRMWPVGWKLVRG